MISTEVYAPGNAFIFGIAQIFHEELGNDTTTSKPPTKPVERSRIGSRAPIEWDSVMWILDEAESLGLQRTTKSSSFDFVGGI